MPVMNSSTSATVYSMMPEYIALPNRKMADMMVRDAKPKRRSK